MSAHALRCFGRNALCVKRKRGEEEDSYEEEEEQERDGSKKTMKRNNKRMMLREEQLCPRVGEGLCVRMRCSMCDHVLLRCAVCGAMTTSIGQGDDCVCEACGAFMAFVTAHEAPADPTSMSPVGRRSVTVMDEYREALALRPIERLPLEDARAVQIDAFGQRRYARHMGREVARLERELDQLRQLRHARKRKSGGSSGDVDVVVQTPTGMMMQGAGDHDESIEKRNRDPASDGYRDKPPPSTGAVQPNGNGVGRDNDYIDERAVRRAAVAAKSNDEDIDMGCPLESEARYEAVRDALFLCRWQLHNVATTTPWGASSLSSSSSTLIEFGKLADTVKMRRMQPFAYSVRECCTLLGLDKDIIDDHTVSNSIESLIRECVEFCDTRDAEAKPASAITAIPAGGGTRDVIDAKAAAERCKVDAIAFAKCTNVPESPAQKGASCAEAAEKKATSILIIEIFARHYKKELNRNRHTRLQALHLKRSINRVLKKLAERCAALCDSITCGNEREEEEQQLLIHRVSDSEDHRSQNAMHVDADQALQLAMLREVHAYMLQLYRSLLDL